MTDKQTLERVARALYDSDWRGGNWSYLIMESEAGNRDSDRKVKQYRKHAKAAIDAMQGWRPISEAPKDGSTMLLFQDGVIETGEWYVGTYPDEFILRPDGAYDKQPGIKREGYWNCNECQMPTHFLPLPQPPTEQKE